MMLPDVVEFLCPTPAQSLDLRLSSSEPLNGSISWFCLNMCIPEYIYRLYQSALLFTKAPGVDARPRREAVAGRPRLVQEDGVDIGERLDARDVARARLDDEEGDEGMCHDGERPPKNRATVSGDRDDVGAPPWVTCNSRVEFLLVGALHQGRPFILERHYLRTLSPVQRLKQE